MVIINFKTTSTRIAPSLPRFPGNLLALSLSQLSRICFSSSLALAVSDENDPSCVLQSKRLERVVIAKCRSGYLCLDDSLHFFQRIIQLRPLPSIAAFSYLLGAVSKMNQHSVVVSMCKQTLGCSDIPLDIRTMNAFVTCLCGLEQVDLGFSVLGMILKLGLQPDSYTMAFLGLCNAGRGNEAVALLGGGMAKPNLITYNILIHGLCSSGQSPEATSMFSRMMNEGVHPDVVTFTTLIDTLCKEKRTKEAFSMLEEMIQRHLQPDIVTYSSLIQGLCNSGQRAEATSLLSRMMNEGLHPDTVTFNTLINALCKEDRIMEALCRT